MAKLDKLFESKPMVALQSFGAWLQQNPIFSAISGGMMGTIGIILAGAVFMILATMLNLVGVLQVTDPLFQWLTMPYNMTLGIMGIAVAFSVAYSYSENLGLKGSIANGTVAMFVFIMVAAPIQSIQPDGAARALPMLDTTYLGGTGLFTALILPIIVVQIIKFCETHNVTIKMPESVPQFFSDSFSALIPLLINIVLWLGLNTLSQKFLGGVIPATLMNLLAAPLSVLVSVPGMFVLLALCQIFWALGIHGTSILAIVLMASRMAAYGVNAELVIQGLDPVFNPVFLMVGIAVAGGTGNLLPLAVQCLRAKSEQLRAVGKAGLIPAVFNISEPIVFGAPIMYNPILTIPFVLNVLVVTFVFYIGYATGILVPPSVLIMGTSLPIILQEFVAAPVASSLFMAPVGFVISYLIYLPFVKLYDKQLCEKEQKMSSEHEAC